MQRMNSDISHIHWNALVIKIWFELRFMDIRLRLFPNSWNTKLLQIGVILKPTKATPTSTFSLDSVEMIIQYRAAVQRAARSRFFFNTSCLRRSLVLRKLLHEVGIETKLVYGLSPHTKGTGHAWLEVISPPSVKGQKIDTLSNPDNFIPLGKGGPVDGT
ncbi:MAG: hypothetical protein CVV52_08715 [Spirochaetae bacterium HGW-Spirochaetae-8]|nr:MAG: hypothetical protein CVV52_08715 [Spirochaetae bacterium HGW-Spirochaetae-8]